jgi:hypothetical protein
MSASAFRDAAAAQDDGLPGTTSPTTSESISPGRSPRGPQCVAIVGKHDRSEFRSFMLALRAWASGQAELIHFEAGFDHPSKEIAAPRDVGDGPSCFDLVVLLRSYPDEWSLGGFVEWLSTMPLARVIVVNGDWCRSVGRTRPAWPIAWQVTTDEAPRRLQRELHVLGHVPRSMSCQGSQRCLPQAIPWTASRAEAVEFDLAAHPIDQQLLPQSDRPQNDRRQCDRRQCDRRQPVQILTADQPLATLVRDVLLVHGCPSVWLHGLLAMRPRQAFSAAIIDLDEWLLLPLESRQAALTSLETEPVIGIASAFPAGVNSVAGSNRELNLVEALSVADFGQIDDRIAVAASRHGSAHPQTQRPARPRTITVVPRWQIVDLLPQVMWAAWGWTAGESLSPPPLPSSPPSR